jgi:hypothetical protein
VAKTQYRYTGSHPQDFDVDGKVLMVEPGGEIELDLDDEAQKQYSYLAEGGMLLDINAKPKSVPAPATGGDK